MFHSLHRSALLPAIIALSTSLALSACGDDSTGPDDDTGVISGRVTVSPPSLINLSGWRVQYYESFEDLEADFEVEGETVQGSGGVYTFRFDDVEPGTYWLDICQPQTLTCIVFTDTGDPLGPIEEAEPFDVRRGQTTQLNIDITN